MDITKLQKVLPSDIYLELSNVLNNRTPTKYQLAQFLANCAHETQGWTKYSESLNYKAPRLLAVFPKYIKNLADATALVKQGQIAIADRVYGGRMGNKKGTSDGFNFRGGGCTHLTGRSMYELFGAAVHEDIASNPDLVRTKYKLTSAFWFYDYNGLWIVANQVNCKPLRKRVNGGVNGLAEVEAYFKKYFALL